MARVRTKVGEYRTQELGRKPIGRGDGVGGISKLGENGQKHLLRATVGVHVGACILIVRSADIHLVGCRLLLPLYRREIFKLTTFENGCRFHRS